MKNIRRSARHFFTITELHYLWTRFYVKIQLSLPLERPEFGIRLIMPNPSRHSEEKRQKFIKKMEIVSKEIKIEDPTIGKFSQK